MMVMSKLFSNEMLTDQRNVKDKKSIQWFTMQESPHYLTWNASTSNQITENVPYEGNKSRMEGGGGGNKKITKKRGEK
jgi:hypothetical protein